MKKLPSRNELNAFVKDYSPGKLFEKIAKVASRAGIKAVYAALLLYYALTDGDVPAKDKAIVIGALGYFILPLDIIPDMLGPLGFTDDFSVLVLACKTIWSNITPNVHAKARARLSEWFGEIQEDDLTLF